VARYAKQRGEQEVYRSWYFSAVNWQTAAQIALHAMKDGERLISICVAGYHL
jgi:hypothetical protein